MSQKLSNKRREQIRETLKQANSKNNAYWTYEDENTAIGDLLAELDRILPSWVATDAGQHQYNRAYEVAGTTPNSSDSVWLGRARYDETWNTWVDANTSKPFPLGTTITHYLHSLTPTELIGQPERGE
ncbi:hypothetical protein [Hymenobacter mucosus]|uniref:Uncharacterized protein n=1 Tax=Hymenobacter mucosus TaxID=1411120 RepID=A0A239A981_9BACT|nr:hypothetical protein [Hymenobacter mucosus]SNR92187.1 hypothetical protein SAMN06269173_11182 [Hymenobacter mucosus]